MAIVQSSLAEDLLSRQEKAVLRSIYRASQLSDALSIVQKIKANYANDRTIVARSDHNNALNQMEQYLRNSLLSALVNTKVPAISVEKSVPQAVNTA